MAATPDVAVSLLQAGAVMGAVLVAQMVVLRHLPVDTIPGILRGRVLLCNRMRPWLVLLSAAMAGSGLVLLLQ